MLREVPRFPPGVNICKNLMKPFVSDYFTLSLLPICRSLLSSCTSLKVAWEHGFKKIRLESDSTAALHHVNKVVPPSHHLAVARDYLNKLARFSHDVLVGGLKYPQDSRSKFHSDDLSKANILPSSAVISYSWTHIAASVAGAEVLSGLYNSSSPAPVLNSAPGLRSCSSSAGDSDSVSGWQFPSKGWVKCNVDGSFLPDKRSAGCGGVYRDTEGKWLYGFAQRIDYYDGTLAEAFAIYRGLTEARRLGYKNVVIESDSRSVVDLLVNKRSSTSDPLAKLVHLILDRMCKKYWKVKIVHVPRKYNNVADRLAHLSHKLLDGELKTYENPPQN